jgi:hypothetical protein
MFSDDVVGSIIDIIFPCFPYRIYILNNQRSAIDYMLMSKEMAQNVKSVFIDEEGKYDLHSDHVIISAETLFNMGLPVWGHISTHLPLKSPIRIIL